MNRLKHYFYVYDEPAIINYKNWIPQGSVCKYCGIYGIDAWESLPKNYKISIAGWQSPERRILELEYYNEICPCITEEEWIIKQIIE